ncbi:DNA-binding NtrC family response regulator [Sulfuritortus calidifontis]|uniref:DNA-binding NtrC family response regulator n=1 Tax=Sulfuritortus calidifontis TaxID=1914471 RepID=A0A4R3JW22_9PROT|nr:sigma-54 dependent transcriptional regulator [Sulfuritortus calidifontis]TCS72371.1 DNA-binding NtrC family response regulator [Sulfuritortus calidifontis]
MTDLARPGSLLIIDDEAMAVRSLSHVFRKEGYEVTTCQSGPAGLKAIEQRRFDVVLTDLRMERVDGMAILKRCRELHPDSEVIVVTGYATLNSAVDAMKEGAFHYVAKPYRLDEVREIVKSAMEVVRLRRENHELRRRIEGYEGQVNIITQDLTMQQLLDTARQVAGTDCNVLITGESGTGKELMARYVHVHSQRVAGPFVAVNCGALQDELLTNELFGHEKGAFTGADQLKRGLIEVAEGGTLFLDEIAEMSMNMQVRLLRVLQERELLRVGGTQPVKVDVRFVAATNRHLQDAVAAGRFRSDLYFRLNVVNLALPPLRDRADDVPLLAYYFLKKHAQAMAKTVNDIEPDAMRLLVRYDYPGNVRELANIIERGVALADTPTLGVAQLPEAMRELTVRVLITPGGSMPTLEANEADYIRRVLEHTRGNRSQAAEILGIDRVSLWRKIKRYGLA